MVKHFVYLFASLSICLCGYSQKGSKSIVYKTESKFVPDVCFTNKGDALVVTDNMSVKIFLTKTAEILKEFNDGHRKQILTIDISKDSSFLASGGEDSIIVIRNFVTGEILRSLTFHTAAITSIQFSPDSKYLISGDSDGIVCLYDLNQDKVIHKFYDHNIDITSVKFSPDGKMIAVTGGDKMIYLYDIEKVELLEVLKGHRNWVRDLSFSSDGEKLISCGDDSGIYLWLIRDLKNIQRTKISNSFLDWITGIDFNVDDRSYAYCSFNGNVYIITPFSRYKTHLKGPVNRIIFKPEKDGSLIVAVATLETGAMIIDAKNMRMKKF